MPTPTYTPLANLTLSSSAASVTFSSISQAYRDLVLVFVPTVDMPDGYNYVVRINLNSDSTATNYSYVRMSGNGTAAATTAATNLTFAGIANVNNKPTNHTINLMDYSATDKHKTMLIRSNNADYGTEAVSMRWANTAAVTSIKLYSDQPYATGSSFSLYGIAS